MSIPLILCGTPIEVDQFDFSEATIIHLLKEEEEPYSKADMSLTCPVIDIPSSDTVSVYSDVLLDLKSLVKGCGEETIVLVSKEAISRGPALAIALRSFLFEGDTDLAVATQVAQRPQCQPSTFISQLADVVYDLEKKLYKSVRDYLNTGMAISSNGETFLYDPTGEGKDSSQDASDFLERFSEKTND